jgi:hypothetical protein
MTEEAVEGISSIRLGAGKRRVDSKRTINVNVVLYY